jgi:hypothetical protein
MILKTNNYFIKSNSNSSKPNRAMKLGTNKDVLPAFIEQQVKQSLPVSKQQTIVPSASSNNTVASNKLVYL